MESLSDRGYLYHFWPQMSQIVAPKIISLTCVWPTYSVCQSISIIHKITAIRKQSKTSFDAYSKQLISTSKKSPSFHLAFKHFLTSCFFHMIFSVYFIFDLFYMYRIHPFFSQQIIIFLYGTMRLLLLLLIYIRSFRHCLPMTDLNSKILENCLFFKIK